MPRVALPSVWQRGHFKVPLRLGWKMFQSLSGVEGHQGTKAKKAYPKRAGHGQETPNQDRTENMRRGCPPLPMKDFRTPHVQRLQRSGVYFSDWQMF
jgi:hypothetical protein